MAEQRVARVGWIVDVQNDFMDPKGRLYVHDLFDASDAGAVQVAPAIERAVRWKRKHCDVLVYTGDWHSYSDREIDADDPDPALETYPPHCMGLSSDAHEREGAAILPSIAPGDDTLVLPRDASEDHGRELAQRAVRERRAVFIQKNEFSVFRGNRATEAFLDALLIELEAPVEFVVCGVATDVCVRHAVEGFLDRAYRVRVISDAMWGLGLLRPSDTLEHWVQRGATLTSVDQLEEGQRGEEIAR